MRKFIACDCRNLLIRISPILAALIVGYAVGPFDGAQRITRRHRTTIAVCWFFCLTGLFRSYKKTGHVGNLPVPSFGGLKK